MADKVYYNPSLGLQNITPALDDDTFLFFLGAYYDWMQSTDVTIGSKDGVFANNEIITGQSSQAKATVRYIGANTITVSMKTDVPFDIGEEIVGATSANSAVILELSDNVLRQVSRVRENKNPKTAQGLFLEYLKQELNKGIPTLTATKRRNLISQLRDFFKSKSTEEAYTFLFRALFDETIELRYPGDDLLRVSDGKFLKQSIIRIGERAVYPVQGTVTVTSGSNIVVGSNSNFNLFSNGSFFRVGTEQNSVANVVNSTYMVATSNFSANQTNEFIEGLSPIDVFNLKNKTIRGRTSGAVAVVSDLRVSFLGGVRYAELILRLISGGFVGGEIIEDIENINSNTTVYGVVSAINIVDGGTGYAVDDDVIIVGDGSEAFAKVTSISDAPISKVVLANTGIGYRNNVEATVVNSGTGGSGFRVRLTEIANTYDIGGYTVGDTVGISIINRGSGYKALPTITLEDTAISAMGMLHEKLIRINDPGTLYEVGDPLVFVGGTGSGVEGRVAAVTERWAETPVVLVASEVVLPYKDESLLDDFGSNTVSAEDDIGILLEQSYYDRIKTEDWRGVGPIERLELANSTTGDFAFGTGYSYPSGLPTVTVSSANGIGANLEVFDIQGRSAVIEIDSGNNVAGIGAIREVTIIDQGIDYTSATVDVTGAGDGNANLTAEVTGIFTNPGYFTNDDGKVNYKVIQDSLFYQDFSYVIRSGLSFDRYKDIVKEVIHPAGLEFFGEIVITSTISLAANFTSEIIADRAPRFVSLFSFLALFEGIGLPPANQQSIVVRIKPFVAYTDNAKLDTHREINVEIAPTVINVAAVTSTEYRPILTPSVDIGVFGSSTVEAIPVSPGQNEFDIVLQGATIGVNLDTGAVREINIEPAAANLQINWIEWQDLNVPKLINLGGATLDVVPTTRYEIDILPVNTINARYQYGDVPIIDFASTSISELADVAFEDYYYYGVATPTATINLLDIDIPAFVSLPVTVYESRTQGNFFTYELDNLVVEAQTHQNIVVQPLVEFNSIIGSHREVVIDIENFVDATMAFYSLITTAQTDIRTTEIDINLLQSVSVITHPKYEIDVTAEQKSVLSDFYDFSEIVVRVENFFDATMAFYSIVTTAETDVRTVEIDVNLFKSVEPVPHPKYEIDLKHNDKYNDFTFEELGGLSIALFDDEPIEDTIAWGRANFISRELQYRNLRILGKLSSATIADYANTKMSSFFSFDNVKKNVKAVGTVDVSGNTVIGTNSLFDSDFLVNDPIIIGDQRFLVKSISNSSYMELNVPSATNYTNTYAYREYVV